MAEKQNRVHPIDHSYTGCMVHVVGVGVDVSVVVVVSVYVSTWSWDPAEDHDIPHLMCTHDRLL